MSVLTQKEIIQEIEAGRIVVDPLDLRNIKSNSIDLRLGEEIKIYVDDEGNPLDLSWASVFARNPPSPRSAFVDGQALKALNRRGAILDPKTAPKTRTFRIPTEGVVLMPGRGYLGTTVEHVRTDFFVPAMHGRSSMGRMFLSPHHTAGWGDTGFDGKWTLEITCQMPTRIYPGMRICQLSFETITGHATLYADIEGSKYQGQQEPVASRVHHDFLKAPAPRKREGKDQPTSGQGEGA